MAATLGYLVITQAILAIFSGTSDALFILFSAATLLPAIIYAGTVLLYIVKRRSLPASAGFSLGRWEVPVLILASVWLVYELLIFRDVSFEQPRLYVGIMLVIGIAYLVYLLATRGRRGLTMPDMADVDRTFDDDTASASR